MSLYAALGVVAIVLLGLNLADFIRTRRRDKLRRKDRLRPHHSSTTLDVAPTNGHTEDTLGQYFETTLRPSTLPDRQTGTSSIRTAYGGPSHPLTHIPPVPPLPVQYRTDRTIPIAIFPSAPAYNIGAPSARHVTLGTALSMHNSGETCELETERNKGAHSLRSASLRSGTTSSTRTTLPPYSPRRLPSYKA